MKTNHAVHHMSPAPDNQPGNAHCDHGSILVPIDFSPESAALREAASSAAETHAMLTVLHVVEGKTYYRGNYTPDVQFKVQQAHARQMENLAETVLPTGVTANLIVVDGDPASEIKRIADERHIGCIIMGSHLHRQHWFGSGTAKKVHDSAPCKVILLHPPANAAAIPA
jgi:nucleotide-binding universal stress UspA family protein